MKLQVNELRIGNLIDLASVRINGTFDVKDRLIDGCPDFGYSPCLVSPELLLELFKKGEDMAVRPTPLTEEWLKWFGFVVYKEWANGIDYILNGFVVHWGKRELPEKASITIEPDKEITLDYVHQLQNLYFALTGEELELK